MPVSARRKTAEALVVAFNNMDVDKIVSYRSPSCIRRFLPVSMGLPDQDNATYHRSLLKLRAIFHNFSLKIQDFLEDEKANRVCMSLRAKADTMAGVYVNEYMWLLDFDASGKKITLAQEFSDSVMERDFYPKLKAAMEKHQAGQTSSQQL
ncbi:hypothetical protein MMC21_004039 [Puttea exsequens]|nr:hypothetical protein [Puttea exsequens]